MIKSGKSELIQDMLNHAHDMIFIIRVDDGHIEYVNQTAIDDYGYTLEEMNEIGIDKFRRTLDKEELFSNHLQELKEKDNLTDYAYIIRKDGTEFPIEVNAKLIHKDGVDYNFAIARDISGHIKSKRSLEDLNKNLELLVVKKTDELQKSVAFLKSHKRALDESNIVSKSDLNGLITYANEKFCEITGYTRTEVIGRPHSLVRHPDTNSEVFRELWRHLGARKDWKGIIKNKKKDGGHYWVDINIFPVFNEKGEVFEYIAVRHDITELMDQRQVLEKIATTDSLTALGNRYKLLHDIQSLENPSIAILNIDRFSEINDLYGDAFGDTLLKELGNTINKLIQDQSSKKLYRLQADEFAILNISLEKTDFVKSIEALIKEIENIAYKVHDEEVMVQLTSSISFEKNNLFITADMALKSAKKKKS